MTSKLKILLASTSPRRIKLLENLDLPFQVIHPKIIEPLITSEPQSSVIENSLLKAQSVLGDYNDVYIVAADTIVVKDKVILGKPYDKEEARKMLRSLSGSSHIVYTGITVIESATGRTVSDVAKSIVYMKKLYDEEISAYIKSGKPLDKAGAYGIQDYGSMIIERIEGCYFNVMGLPMSLLHDIFKKFGVNLLDIQTGNYIS
jgi:septum formation protein